MDDCVFCKIVRNEIPSFKIYEDENYLAFLDITQFTKGHTLLIPKQHVSNLWELDDVCGISQILHKIGKHFISLGYRYVDTLTFGRLVPHLHFHLVPHNGDDPNWEKGLSGLEYLHEKKKMDSELLKSISEEFKL